MICTTCSTTNQLPRSVVLAVRVRRTSRPGSPGRIQDDRCLLSHMRLTGPPHAALDVAVAEHLLPGALAGGQVGDVGERGLGQAPMRAMSCETVSRATRAVLPRSSLATIRAFALGWIGASSVASKRVPMLIAHAPRAGAATSPAPVAKPPEAMTGMVSLRSAAGMRTRPGTSSGPGVRRRVAAGSFHDLGAGVDDHRTVVVAGHRIDGRKDGEVDAERRHPHPVVVTDSGPVRGCGSV
ncbi:hypothetical protein ABH920_004519 [Catenulispora sp. EB89]